MSAPGTGNQKKKRSVSSKRLSINRLKVGDIKGMATAEGVDSAKKEYWTISIPSGVLGTCNNTVTVSAVPG